MHCRRRRSTRLRPYVRLMGVGVGVERYWVCGGVVQATARPTAECWAVFINGSLHTTSSAVVFGHAMGDSGQDEDSTQMARSISEY